MRSRPTSRNRKRRPDPAIVQSSATAGGLTPAGGTRSAVHDSSLPKTVVWWRKSQAFGGGQRHKPLLQEFLVRKLYQQGLRECAAAGDLSRPPTTYLPA